MDTLTICFEEKTKLSEREEKAAQDLEKSLNGLTFQEINRVLARVISKVNDAIYSANVG